MSGEDQNTSVGNVFSTEDANKGASSTTDTSSAEPKHDPYLGLVGEGKKYKTPEDLAKSRLEADQFIDQLKNETAGLREELEKRPSKDEILDIVRSTRNDTTENQGSGLDEETVLNLVDTQVTAIEQRRIAQSNAEKAANKVLELYGDKASEFTQGKANELGVSVDYLLDMASRSPDAFFATVGISGAAPKTNSSNQAPQSTVNTEAFDQRQNESAPVGSWDHFEKLRVENPSEYWSPKVQNAIFKARKESGGDFYSK